MVMPCLQCASISTKGRGREVVHIRLAELADIHQCVTIDASFVTDHVWQMDGGESDWEVSTAFRKVRLPRPMNVRYPRELDGLFDDWRLEECFLVAASGESVIAYLDMTVQKWSLAGWINHIVVHPEVRRKGIGTALLRAAGIWARENGLRNIIVETQTKNHPAVSFYQKNAYRFCGFNDQYYTNQDIALFFALSIQ